MFRTHVCRLKGSHSSTAFLTLPTTPSFHSFVFFFTLESVTASSIGFKMWLQDSLVVIQRYQHLIQTYPACFACSLASRYANKVPATEAVLRNWWNIGAWNTARSSKSTSYKQEAIWIPFYVLKRRRDAVLPKACTVETLLPAGGAGGRLRTCPKSHRQSSLFWIACRSFNTGTVQSKLSDRHVLRLESKLAVHLF